MTETAPRSLWMRFVDFPLVRLVIEIALIVVPIAFFGSAIISQNLIGDAPGLLLGACTLAAIVGAIWYRLYYRWLRRARDAELPATLRGALPGIGVGVGLFAAVMAILAAVGAASFDAEGSLAGAIRMLGLSISSAVLEELIVRGVIFRNLEDLLGSWIAVALSAALFGALHASNPNATTASSVAIALEAGVLLAAIYMATRSLWWPIGMHFGWNFTQGGIFGVAVSGTKAEGLLKTSLSGPDWLTGGAFGAEASVVAVIVCLSCAVVFIVRAVRTEPVVSPLWSRRRAPA